MWTYPKKYDVIVVGAGHAGCEAAYISSKKGAKTLLLTMNLDTIAKLSCNPSIGGTAKGHIVREIDALGGIQAKIADSSAIHYRLLNASKGAASQAPRAQVDKLLYQNNMKHFLENVSNLEIKQASVEDILEKNQTATGVTTIEGVLYLAKTIVITSGTFMAGKIFIGNETFSGGRAGDKSSNLSNSLKKLGLHIDRLKTGTPPRIHKRSIDFEKVDLQSSDKGVRFSFQNIENKNQQVDCYITYTTEETKQIVEKNIKKCALFSGKIKSVGPRYCPSIEDKITRFKDKIRHQVFLEPEGVSTQEFYVNGISSSMPFSVQLQIIQSIKGLENAEITRAAYAIEYDYVTSNQITPLLETKKIENLFLAGQINGTTGYEEAAGQGLIAGINAANRALKKEEFILSRSNSYIGVMIDDLVTKEIKEPYRMFTSRAEYRLLLRHDTADIRLTEIAYLQGTVDKKVYLEVEQKKKIIEKEKIRFFLVFKKFENKKLSLAQIISRPDMSYEKIKDIFPKDIKDYGFDINRQIEIDIKYAGYIKRQAQEISRLQHLKKINIPKNFLFNNVKGLRNEALEQLNKFNPQNLDIASKLQGISFADISILMVAIKKYSYETKNCKN